MAGGFDTTVLALKVPGDTANSRQAGAALLKGWACEHDCEPAVTHPRAPTHNPQGADTSLEAVHFH